MMCRIRKRIQWWWIRTRVQGPWCSPIRMYVDLSSSAPSFKNCYCCFEINHSVLKSTILFWNQNDVQDQKGGSTTVDVDPNGSVGTMVQSNSDVCWSVFVSTILQKLLFLFWNQPFSGTDPDSPIWSWLTLRWWLLDGARWSERQQNGEADIQTPHATMCHPAELSSVLSMVSKELTTVCSTATTSINNIDLWHSADRSDLSTRALDQARCIEIESAADWGAQPTRCRSGTHQNRQCPGEISDARLRIRVLRIRRFSNSPVQWSGKDDDRWPFPAIQRTPQGVLESRSYGQHIGCVAE